MKYLVKWYEYAIMVQYIACAVVTNINYPPHHTLFIKYTKVYMCSKRTQRVPSCVMRINKLFIFDYNFEFILCT